MENDSLDDTIKPIAQENHGLASKSVILLPEKFTEYICNKTQTNRTVGRPSKFNLEHDGNTVTAVHEFSIT
jgi:hypothetical protein